MQSPPLLPPHTPPHPHLPSPPSTALVLALSQPRDTAHTLDSRGAPHFVCPRPADACRPSPLFSPLPPLLNALPSSAVQHSFASLGVMPHATRTQVLCMAAAWNARCRQPPPAGRVGSLCRQMHAICASSSQISPPCLPPSNASRESEPSSSLHQCMGAAMSHGNGDKPVRRSGASRGG